jgi:hypothetical protein
VRARDPRKLTELMAAGLELMGCPLAILQDIQKETDVAVAQDLLDRWRAEVKKSYREAVLEHHPDRGGDPEKLIILNEAWAIIQELKILHRRPPPPPPPPVQRPTTIINIRFHGFQASSFYGPGTGSATTTGTGGGWPW